MASMEGLVPITRHFLASYYDKYPFAPLSDHVSRLSTEMLALANSLLDELPPTSGFIIDLYLNEFLFAVLGMVSLVVDDLKL